MKKLNTTDYGLLILRVIPAAFMAAGHGWQKLANFSEYATRFPDPIGVGPQFGLTLATGAEFFCSLLLILGIGTRVVAIPILITMLVAGGIVHAADPWGHKELPFLFGTIFLTLILTGGGKFSLGPRLIKTKWPIH